MIDVNYSFGLLKPDCLKRGIEKEVLIAIESVGLEIVAIKRVRLTKNEVDIIWVPCLKEDFYNDLLEFSLSGDCIVFIAKGDDAITKLNDLVGHYDPARAEKGTIRHRFGTSLMENVIHSTSTEETFWKEVFLFYPISLIAKLVNSEL